LIVAAQPSQCIPSICKVSVFTTFSFAGRPTHSAACASAGSQATDRSP
jgi:hypothetical protein